MSASIPLKEQRVTLHAAPDDLYRYLTEMEGPRIVERRENMVIAEFAGQIGPYHWRTRERVRFDPNRRRITFEQLRPPFFTVRTAVETFDVGYGPGGMTTLVVNGMLMPRLGPFGWLVTRGIVRPAWERIERKHLARLSDRFGSS